MADYFPVGGEILDLALERAKEFSRFVMCGGEQSDTALKLQDTHVPLGISQYNTSNPKGPKVNHPFAFAAER